MRPSAPWVRWPEAAALAPQAQTMQILDTLRSIVGRDGLLTAPADLAGYRSDSTHRSESGILGVVRPAGTAQVAQVLLACGAAGVPVVARGGGTGFAGGCLPLPGQDVLLLSLSRMNRIRALDPVGNVIVAEAGCLLHEAQQAAREAGRMIGLDHGGAGSSTLGGNIGTNAGGNNVVRYGMARDQLLGLEAVLADGSVLAPPSTLRKSNAGYDLRHLLAGSEGTLAVITAVALKLRPAPVASATALLGVNSPQAALDLFGAALGLLGDALSAFELMSRESLEFHFAHLGSRHEPFDAPTPWIVLIEAESTSRFMNLEAAFDELLQSSLASGCVRDGSVACSIAQRRSMWALREGIAVAMGASRVPMVKTDTAVPVGRVPEFVARTQCEVERCLPGSRLMYFGHVGDGNIHLNVLPGADTPASVFRPRMADLSRCVDGVALALDGTVSAEHGIGQGKREALPRMRSPRELELMAAIKAAFDPQHLLNPGKVLPAAATRSPVSEQ